MYSGNPKNFALIGVAGYIAPRHLQAIKDTGNKLIAALDKNDSVGILDRYFDNVSFFTEYERFDRYAEKLRRQAEDKRIHYVSICSPNYLHDAHIRFALRIGAHALCEKPLVTTPWNLDALSELEKESGKKVYTILQLRVHPAILALKDKIDRASSRDKYMVDLSYITARGNWYFYSWKGDVKKSGGIATNIGIHFFDLLLWLFGRVQYQEVHYANDKKIGGYLELEKARVRWFLSVDKNDLFEEIVKTGKSSYRSIKIDGKELEITTGFDGLHSVVYENILNGKGCGIEEARASIELAYNIRNTSPNRAKKDHYHPLLVKFRDLS
jgi:UDP-N-acetyl-2-amino-2-deoxyglucuronate dehydrogenase